jgi:hypothetical protein
MRFSFQYDWTSGAVFSVKQIVLISRINSRESFFFSLLLDCKISLSFLFALSRKSAFYSQHGGILSHSGPGAHSLSTSI